MRNHFLAAFAATLILSSGSGHCQDSEGALGDPAPPPVQDPSLSNSRYFPASLGTSGVAAIAPRTSPAKPGRAAGCSATNPCARPTPARDRVVVGQR
jgi:hypothetical protein